MAATSKELLDNNPQWSHEEACAAECGWDAAIAADALKPPTNSRYATALEVYHLWASDSTPHTDMPDFDVWCKERLHAEERHKPMAALRLLKKDIICAAKK